LRVHGVDQKAYTLRRLQDLNNREVKQEEFNSKETKTHEAKNATRGEDELGRFSFNSSAEKGA
jgi:hypothetical protein